MKILQVVMNLDYGGVESYVARISKAMVAMGHDVAVLSAGGPMEEAFKGSGVEVIKHSLKENLDEVAKTISGLGFDIINGHNYNSARAGAIISSLTGIPHVMTVHGPRPLFKRITYRYWSDHIITISEADKRGITGFMGISPERVHRSFLPIDSDHFHRFDVDDTLRRKYWGDDNCKLILHISRFTNRKAQVAYQLIDAMETILKAETKARLLIVGSGEKFDSIASRAETAKRSLGDVIRVETAHMDVSSLFNMSSITIATATTAMEALACGAPLIAAGRTGYIGLVTRNNFDMASDLLFADHGKSPHETTSELLTRDIIDALLIQGAILEDSVVIAKTMAECYTPTKAAESVLGIYELVLSSLQI